MANLIGQLIGAIIPSLLLMLLASWVFKKMLGDKITPYWRFTFSVIASFIAVLWLSALGNADGGLPDYQLAFFKSSPSHLVATLIMARMFNKK